MLKVQGLAVYYDDMQALRDVTFELGAGEVCSIVGANGAGKTTTLKAISGLLRPAAGRIELDGKRLDGLPPHAIVDLGVIHVPEGRKIFPSLTVLENLLMGGYSRRARAERPKNLARVFELFPILAERRTQAAGTLSGGEQQMLAIGRGLMAGPRLLMLDEPSLGLAPLIVREMFEVVRAIHAQGVPVLLVEQNVIHSLQISDRAYVLENGAVVMSGPAGELMEDPRLREAYLGL
jgi:branched-chain amino acid transport system ATP-binding protein